NATGNNDANVLRGNAGINTLAGGAGNDTYFAGTEDTIVEGAGGGTDTVFAGTGVLLGAELEKLGLVGTAAFGGGNDLDNSFTANALPSLLEGGPGNDTYVLRNPNDVVIEAFDGGTDTVITRFSYVLDNPNVENVVLTGYGSVNATGNAGVNSLI